MQSPENACVDFVRWWCWEKKAYSRELRLIRTSSSGPCGTLSSLLLSPGGSEAAGNAITSYPTLNLFSLFLSAGKCEKEHRNTGVGIQILIIFLGTSARFSRQSAFFFLKWVTFTFGKTFRADKKAARLLKWAEIFPCHQMLSRAAKQAWRCKGWLPAARTDSTWRWKEEGIHEDALRYTGV